MVSKRVDSITPFLVMDVLEMAQAMEQNGTNVIHLEVGEPDLETPLCIRDAMCKAIEDGHTGYTPSLGNPRLREVICQHYFTKYKVLISPDQVVITSGTSPAMLLVFSTLLESDDEVILSDPHYACYPNFIKFAGGIPVTVPVNEEDGFQYKPEAIGKKITRRTRGIMINSPSNPTGNLLSKDRMQSIANFSPYIISDEIYHDLVYEGEEHSILEFTDNAFVFNGFSKAYAMTGLRLGYAIVPPLFIRPIQKLQQNLFICANSTVQIAGIVALEEAGPDIELMRQIYDKRRQYMIKQLRDMGFGITIEPTGAFYIFANAKHISNDSYKLSFDILKKAHVGVTPGIDFGQNGQGYLRFSYANSMENIIEGLNRIRDYLDCYR